jgi:hypothetical protein
MIGCHDTIRMLSAQLMTYRLVSIVGGGGVGKTAIGISVAHALLEGFNGAAFFVDLAALTDVKLVPTSVASAIGLMQTKDPLLRLPAFIGDRKSFFRSWHNSRRPPPARMPLTPVDANRGRRSLYGTSGDVSSQRDRHNAGECAWMAAS